MWNSLQTVADDDHGEVNGGVHLSVAMPNGANLTTASQLSRTTLVDVLCVTA
jgi:hypothetical protein